MKFFKEYLLVFLVSGEFIITLMGLALGFVWPALLNPLSSKISASDKAIEYIALLPTALLAWNFNECRKLLFPEEDKKRLLQQWPDYWRLKVRFHVALIYSFIFSVLGVFTWLIAFSFRNPTHLAIVLSSTLGALIVTISVYLAKIKIEEIFAENK